jgi:outer membrane receptor for ferrienterochelin and colicin
VAQTPEVEEVVVTGSYIRRSEGFTAASAVTQFSADDLTDQGTVNLGEVVQNLSFVSGAASAVTNSVQGTSSNVSSVDLRGLGASATLTLMDGKRVPSRNVNKLMPGIAIERLDIVVDGAAALYGSEAVAGVVNFIPVKEYEGFKVEAFTEADDRGDYEQHQAAFLMGKELAPGIDFVLAGAFRDEGNLSWSDRPDLMRAGLSATTTGNPGNFSVPRRDANGNLTGAVATRPDPNCGTPRQDPTVQGNNTRGFLASGRCWYESGVDLDWREKNQVSTIYSNLSYDYSPDLSFSAQVNYARQLENGRSSTSNPGGRDTELPVIRGELPGNPFRAVDSLGRPLFARDSNRDTLPDRNANGVVILDPAGIPFNEDVRINGWRPFGKSNTLPSTHNSDGSMADEGDDRDIRVVLQSDFAVPFIAEWQGTAFYTWMEAEDRSRSTQTLSFKALSQALRCDVLKDRAACFNPFAVVNPANLTSVHVMDQISTRYRQLNKSQLQTFDLILNGNLPFSTPAGDIGAAVGFQRREDKFDNRPPANVADGDQFIGAQVYPFAASRNVDAAFVELAVPVLSNLELSAAVRTEKFSTGQKSTDPKIGLVYAATDWLSLRATTGESFIAPTLNQLNAPQTCGLSQAADPFSDFNAFVASCSQGNPALVSESSENMSFGFDLLPIEGLSISVTWNETDFVDRIVATSTADILRADFFNFQQSTGFAKTTAQPFPTLTQLSAWVNSPLSDKRVIRNPADLTKINTIIQSDSNASRIIVKGTDLRTSYTTDIGAFGTLRLGLDATYTDSYEYQLSADRPAIEGVGEQNGPPGAIPALPRWKANGTINWSMGPHIANLTVHYVDSVNFDENAFAFQAAFPFSNYRTVDVIRAWTDVDAFYSYRDIAMFGGSSALTIGVRNLFDRQAQKTGMTSGVVAELQDPLGRVIYARVNFEL